ncbi:hypothetical protein DFQ28_009005 [Apophysomyces sp. BC1034]|nr:hypothetical protein DFQ30_008637 [Apophysomyces sp. BC1015]KAG0174022.1 hypothetical protein DFQ29_007648 [Apophysomyces sp. BC1021]KAG0185675.1 hypothetical protein DFQ28_009005 [Apophysomyces sp. BC1034]
MKINAVALLSFASAVMAFENTVPCLMWSPKNYVEPKDQLFVAKDQAMSTISSSFSSDICKAKVVAVIDQPQLHASDFSRTEYKDAFALLREHHREAGSRAKVEYIADHVDVDQVAAMISRQCDSTVAIVDPETVSSADIYVSETPAVAVMSLPAGKSAEIIQKNDYTVDRLIEAVKEKAQDDYVVIYTSSASKIPSASAFHKRALRRRAPHSAVKLPVFAKYQLFTPAIFMGVGIGLIFVVILAVGLGWLVSIQTPIRFEGKPKKN